MNIADYLDWRGDIPFSVSPFNEVDNVILSEIIYAAWEAVMPDEGGITLRQAAKLYREKNLSQSFFGNDPTPVLLKAGESRRFGNVRAVRFVKESSRKEQWQFAAITFLLPDKTAYLAFRGTDDSIEGWEEDFRFSFAPVTEGQRRAAAYTEKADALYGVPLQLGGHSKGGNFAVYAASHVKEDTFSRILTVWSNDGPGFKEEVTKEACYAKTLPKVKKLIPESSVVGILLSGEEVPKIVACASHGVAQHNPNLWQVWGNAFVNAEKQSASSRFLNKALGEWVAGLSDEELKNLSEGLFVPLKEAGIETVGDIAVRKRALIKAFYDAAKQREEGGSFKKLLRVSGEVLKKDALQTTRQVKEKIVKTVKSNRH